MSLSAEEDLLLHLREEQLLHEFMLYRRLVQRIEERQTSNEARIGEVEHEQTRWLIEQVEERRARDAEYETLIRKLMARIDALEAEVAALKAATAGPTDSVTVEDTASPHDVEFAFDLGRLVGRDEVRPDQL